MTLVHPFCRDTDLHATTASPRPVNERLARVYRKIPPPKHTHIHSPASTRIHSPSAVTPSGVIEIGKGWISAPRHANSDEFPHSLARGVVVNGQPNGEV
ncbi:hypothetical protein AVEN_165374-1 [Araneus ventricosus]|uniref:Uncharacterized protein n=1 Tax=Araneus ventricosus TaxID=182803 RepID=A0A4Y2AV69_ARAVE|nr:hypothetical protein AVEN_165374-1 [Araneus ventricosus]